MWTPALGRLGVKIMNKNVFNMPNPVTIMGRSSSITNSFVNGIIPVIEPTESEIREALKILEQNEDDVDVFIVEIKKQNGIICIL